MNTKNITLSNNDKLTFISNLSTMLGAGIPLLESVESLMEDSKGNLRKLLTVLREDLVQGKHVYNGLEKFPKVFDKVAINIIRASEEAGTLDVVLKDLKQNIKKDIEFSDKIRSALVYPLFIVLVFFGVLFMILIVVVPKISQVFSRLRTELPLPTRILIFMSNALLQNTILVVGGIVILVVGLFFLYRKNKQFIFSLFIYLPVISELVKQIDLTRFARSLYLLLNAGIPITDAMSLAQEVVSKKDVIKAVKQTKEFVGSGKKLSEGFRQNKKIFPSIMIRITEAGERSGGLDKSLQEVSEFMDYQVSGTLKTATTLIEPLLLVVIGSLIGGMMLAIIAPIYGLIGEIGAR